MTDLNHYMRDGADVQSRCILAILQGLEIDDWRITRWDYGIEQGYTIYKALYTDTSRKQLNISFFKRSYTNEIVLIYWNLNTSFIAPQSEQYYLNKQEKDIETSTIIFESFDFKSVVDHIAESMAQFG